jgi:peptidyl-prolyl cis-trans isomerase SurA
MQLILKRLPTLAILALFSLLAIPHTSQAQLGITRPRGQELVDGIIVKVDNQIVLRSEVENIYSQEVARAQGKPLPPDLKCKILQSLVLNRLMLARAEVDSVTVTDQRVNSELDRRMAYFVQQIGSEKKLEVGTCPQGRPPWPGARPAGAAGNAGKDCRQGGRDAPRSKRIL